ncbi:MAG: lytic transglycosylase domain-containing protein [Acinetobacter sp.]
MAQITWEAMNPIDTSRYLDAIQKAQAQSVAGVEQIGNAYKGYQDNLKKQNTNDMLTALNQAQNPEQLATAQANIAAMQQRWGSGYDMDTVRTAMDERPAVLMQRQSAEMDFKDKQANIAARPEVAAIQMAQLKSLGGADEQLARIKAMADSGVDTTSIADSYGQFLTNDRNFTNENFWKLKNFNQSADQFEKTFKQNAYQYSRTATREEQESALSIGKTLYEADQASGAGTTYVAADGTEYTTGGGGGGAAIANYASKFGPLAGGMIHAESKGNPNAVSPVGAQGIIQIMPKTAAKPGYGMSPIDLKNTTPEEQIRWGMEYRSRIQKAHGFTEDQATAAYNAGAGKVQQAIKQAKDSGGNWLSYLPKETRDYVPRVNAATAKYGGAAAGGNTPATAPMAGIDRKVQQKIRGAYQNAMLKYNEDLALKDQPVNVGNVLAGLTAKEKGSAWTQDSFDIVNALKDNEQLKGLSAEGITNVYNRAKAWQSKPGTPLVGFNSSNGLKKSIDNIIKDEIGIDAKRKEHVAKASHPSNTYVQKIQQEFEANGVSISAKEALLHIDPARYESLYGKPTVKVQEALNKKEEKAQAATKPNAKTSTATAATAAVATAAAKPKPASQAFIPFAKPVTTMKPNASGTTTKPTPQASTPKAETKVAKPSKQDVVAFYVKRGEVGNVVPNGINSRTDRELIREAQAEATKQLAAKEAKQKADAAVKKAASKAEAARVSKEFEAKRTAKPRTATPTQTKPVDMAQMYKTHMQQKAKEEAERKRKNK